MKRVNRYNLILILFAGLFTATTVQAQNDDLANTGSFYSGIGFGLPVDSFSPYSMGMGLSGVANYSGFSTNIANPGQWGLAGFSQATLSAGLSNIYSSDLNSSTRNANFGIDQFQITFPIIRNRLAISASITPMARGDFRRVSSGLYNPLPGLANSIRYDFTTSGSGGVNRFETGFGFALTNQISVGYAFSANLLSMNETVVPEFTDDQFRAVNFERKKEGYSFGHRFGLYAFAQNLIGSEDQLSFGATLSLPVEIEAEQKVTAFRAVDNQSILVDYNENSPSRNGTIKLPLEFNTGLTYNLNRFINVGAELLLQQWSDALYSFDTNQQNLYKDRARAGFGVQYHPYRADQTGGFFSKMKYSTGVTYDTGSLEINGENIETIYFNAGIGLMSVQSTSSIDLSVHYGIRGTESLNLVKENIWGFKLSLNLAEWMFVRQRFQ